MAGVSDEVERKFLVREVPASLGEGTPLRQAYLAVDGGVEVRVRDQGSRYVLTVKGGHGLRRTEVEVDIGAAEFDELWALAPDRRITKTRHRVPVGDHVAEVDVYSGPLEGLVVVEVEFPTTTAAHTFTPPPWFADDLTNDPRYSNATLATTGLPTP